MSHTWQCKVPPLSTTKLRTLQATPLVPKAQLGLEKRAHSKEMALLLGKPLPKYNNQAGSLTTPCSKRRNGSLMQPRQGF